MGGLLVKSNQHGFDSLAHLVQPQEWQKKQFGKAVELGIPTSKDEAWKYTSLNDFNALPLQLAMLQSAENISYEGLSLGIDAYRLVFFDGYFSARCSDWIPKVRVTPLNVLTSVETYELSRSVRPDAFTHLNDATATGGVLIEVEPNTQVNKPIYLLHISSGQKGEVCSYHHHIEMGPLSELEVIEHHISLAQGGGVTLSRLTNYVGEGACFHHTKLIEESPQQHHFGHNDIRLQRDAKASSTSLLLSGLLLRTQTSSELCGDNGEIAMNSISLPTDKQTFDTRTYLKHNAPHCQSEQIHKIIGRDQSNAVFDGMIYVDPTALKTDGQMDTHSLLLSDKAQVNCKPQLEIYADDVKCSHGATTGQLDPNQIAYMRARGINRFKAEQILMSAFVCEVAEKIRHRSLRDYVISQLNSSLHGEISHG
ncbi:Fe-S cluster assembly protein SufD [Vibrio tubiashii]|uniref:Fe-S cluster assembly protein SufD n=1 Tax=Vibrio tubiashii TaxID=29498 RepID=UPI001EFED515|nr:Fe-S cluster assembly protein SufD [Vibrio tubiashii]MCG9582356.1 Fe-S cluster assembly protein SufD [Vibrio tubiashii]MCG9615947.1 Fe-S cluster assembly protein SufD [Vibrio tubiashii]MCG9687518.1 Fe-S cluster assembly protein SufD [Vibrio tubiashii]